MALQRFTLHTSWKDWLDISRSTRRTTLATALVASLVGIPAALRAADTPAQIPAAVQPGSGALANDDTTRHELRNFDRYLDRHPKVRRELSKDPALINNPDFVAKHSSLQKFLGSHPGAREALKANPSAFMKKEARFEKGKVLKHGKHHAHRATKS